MLQKRLNNIAILYTHQDSLENLDVEELLDIFIRKNNIRAATFAI